MVFPCRADGGLGPLANGVCLSLYGELHFVLKASRYISLAQRNAGVDQVHPRNLRSGGGHRYRPCGSGTRLNAPERTIYS